MTRYRLLATVSVWAGLGCGTLKTRTDALDLLRRCTSKQGPLDGYCGTIEVWENCQAKTGRKICMADASWAAAWPGPPAR